MHLPKLRVTGQWMVSGWSVDGQWMVSGLSVDGQWIVSDRSVDGHGSVSDLSVTGQWMVSDRIKFSKFHQVHSNFFNLMRGHLDGKLKKPKSRLYMVRLF